MLQEIIAERRQEILNRVDPPMPAEVPALQAEVARLRAELKAAELGQWDLKEVLRQEEAINTPTEDQEICERLSEALATMEEFAAYLPPMMARDFQDGFCELVDRSRWPSKPHLIRRILPILLEDQLTAETSADETESAI